MRTEKKIILIIAVILVVIGIGMMAVSVMTSGLKFVKAGGTSEYEQKKYDVAEDFDNLKITIGFQDIAIERSEDGQTHYICYEDDNTKFDVEVQGKTLIITQRQTEKWDFNFNFSDFNVHSTLYLPKDIYENVAIITGSGDVSISSGFNFSDLDVKVGSGEIDIQDFESIAIKLETGSGDIDLKSCDAKDITIITGSGDVRGTLKSGKKFDAVAGSGDVDVPASSGEGTCKVRTGSGDIDFEIEN